jgi:hypothetical protein
MRIPTLSTWALVVLGCASAGHAIDFLVAPAFPTGLAPQAVALADLDGDGDQDVVTVDLADQFTGTVTVSLNDGAGGFAPSVSYPVGAGASWLAVADLNHDSRPDVVVSNSQAQDAGALTVYLNAGDGTLVSPHTLSAPGNSQPEGIEIADFNGDGNPDVAVALSLQGQVKVFFGNGTGAFPTSVSVNTGFTPRDVAAAQFDGDGILDFVVNSVDGAIVFYGTGTNFVAGPFINDFTYGCDHVVTGDFDGDGHPDFATTGRALTLFLSDGTGHGWTLHFSPVGENPVGLVAGDFDGDGHLDLAASVYLGDAISVYYGDGSGAFPVRRDWGVGLAPNDLAVGDVDGDSLPDFVAPSSQLSQTDYQVVINRGDRRYHARRDYDVGGDAEGFALADFDHDGTLDALVGAYVPNLNHLELLRGNADGTWREPETVETFGNNQPTNVIAADFNEDGWMDAAASIFSPGNAMRVWLNDGQGGLLPSVAYPSGGNPGSLASGDLDGDGHADVVVVNSALTDNSISVFFGLGNGTFQSGIRIPTLTAPSDVAIADFDLDGDLDVLVTHGVATSVLLFVNDGSGNLSPTAFPVGSAQGTPAVADLDGDGWPDVALTTGFAGALINDQAGGFTLRPTPVVATGGVGVADFDHDGDVDLVAADFNRSLATILVNDGTAHFTTGPVVPVGYESGRCTGVDLTHDSLPEIVTANLRAGTLSTVTNTTRTGIFTDGFESGDTGAWSVAVP